MPFFRRFLFLSTSLLALNCSSESGDGGDSGSGNADDSGGLISESCEPANDISLSLDTVDVTDVIQDNLVSSVTIPDELSQRQVLLEIWSFKDGEPDDLVWSFSSNGNSTFSVALSDGTFAATLDALENSQDHGLRAGYLIEDCTFPDWTEWQLFTTESGASFFFESNTIPTLDFHIPNASYASINAEARPPGCVPYERNFYTGNVSFEGQEFPGAGLRVKGGCGSARFLEDKAGFKSNLSWDDPNIDGCPETRRLHGLKKLTINNQIQDQSNAHERISYHFYKLLDIPTPRVAPISLNVNDESWGLYLNVESIDRRFLSRWFGSNQGALFEGTYSCDLDLANIPPDENTIKCYSAKFTPDECDKPDTDPEADPPGFGPLEEFITAVNAIPASNFYAEISQLIDMPRFLNLMAADVIIANWDGYMFNRNNYRMYRDPSSNKWTFLPTGIDQTLVDRSIASSSRLDTNPFPGGGGRAVEGIVAQRCQQDPQCNSEFIKAIKLAISVFENAVLNNMAEDIRLEIADHVMSDPRTTTSFTQWNAALDLTKDFISNRPAQVRGWLTAAGY